MWKAIGGEQIKVISQGPTKLSKLAKKSRSEDPLARGYDKSPHRLAMNTIVPRIVAIILGVDQECLLN